MYPLNLNYTEQAAKRIKYFCEFDPPIANALHNLLRRISDGDSSGRAYRELDKNDQNQLRLLQALEFVRPGDTFTLHWDELESRALHTRVLVVVVFAVAKNTVVAVGYIPRQQATLR